MTGLKIKLGIAAIFLLAAHVIDAQVFVKVKPTRPAVVIAKPSKAKQGHIWVDGHWQWSKKQHCYVWRKGQWKKKQKGQQWIPGHWKNKPGGHVWITGHWKRA